MKFTLAISALASLAAAAVSPVQSQVQSRQLSQLTLSTLGSSGVDVITFDNFGYDGTYFHVKSLGDASSDTCSCKLSSDAVYFTGTNAPLNEELSVHFRGPLSLHSFAWYTSANYTHGSSEGTWERQAYYNASTQTSDNVTFLTHGGDSSTCLGKALSYAGSNGTESASASTVLASDNLIGSNEEFIIFSNVSCPSSGYSKDCGVYRSGIPAYYGFYGDIKMFTFEFEMPSETSTDEDTTYYDMPAIWLLNAHIPRTSQYGTDAYCSCWNSGCGEFDIFEVMNSTTTDQLYSTLHDYQGTDDINDGIQAAAYITRDTSKVMKGGVVFDSSGKAIVFMLDLLTNAESISATTVNDWIDNAGTETVKSLSSIAAATSTSKKSGASGTIEKLGLGAILLSMVFLAFMYI